ncbi:MAG: M23 family metallopeptidase [Leptolinea sp.]|jgi:murein DD-endopeptidase MepM/ murein hydrolase activator NlpD|nr:M23 family metallopeptidase [Leptolinea sp.]
MNESNPIQASDLPDGFSKIENTRTSSTQPDEPLSIWMRVWQVVQQHELTEQAMRLGTGLASVSLILISVWVMNSFFLTGNLTNSQKTDFIPPKTTPTIPPEANPSSIKFPLFIPVDSITRMVDAHTSLPAKPRTEIIHYIVQKGDTIFAIATKFNLRPQTILWGNYGVLADNPHYLSPGQDLTILPVDGVYHQWHAGEGLNGVAKFYGVSPDVIVDYPGNGLNRQTLGDFSNPNIEPGKMLIVPGGQREFVVWSAPRITRSDPAVAKIYGPGACGSVVDGTIGSGIFLWPAPDRFISGFDYSPETGHYAIDIGGQINNGVFASDGGVIVYAGWNDYGYGNVVVIDHGNGWQTLYAHLNSISVACGQSVSQGQVIGLLGSTGKSSGPHLHFEMRSDTYGRVDPKAFLQ